MALDPKQAIADPFFDKPKNNFIGPCSAETREQVMATADGIAEFSKDIIFRAGIWKPRTRPNSFEGIGEEGLKWLLEAKQKHGFRIAVEVANAKHVEAALQAGVDVLWIGARTTVNPFSVQDIADALLGVDVEVFVKNPIFPDLALWLGALERIEKANVSNLGAIHRGFQTQDNGPYRNKPLWDLAIRLRSRFPHLPLICDASHIAGKPELLSHVSQKAIDLDMDGLMIETHVDPIHALSDAQQQITPAALIQLIAGLTPKKKESENTQFKSELERLRELIDDVDDDIIERIAVRMNLARQIGDEKRKNNVMILQIERWKRTMERILKNGNSLGLSQNFIEGILHLLHDESIRKQSKKLDQKG